MSDAAGGERGARVAPMVVSIIVAYDQARVIGRDGGMPWHLPADLAHFKHTTMGHHLIVGRKTFASIGRKLPGRPMIVVSRGQPPLPEGVDLAPSLEAALDQARRAGESEAFVAGGGEIYRQALAAADRMYVTEIGEPVSLSAPDRGAQPGDVRFPAWDPGPWRQVEVVERAADEANPRPLRFLRYERLR